MHKIISTDIIIVGSGIAGLTAALNCAKFGKVILICKDKLSECNTNKAQGGVAVSVSVDDSPALHFKDTVKTGAGLSDEKAVRFLTRESKKMLKELSALGAKFDEKNGKIDLRIEGAHSRNRIVHIKGDYTGREIEKVLIDNVRKSRNIEIKENEFLMNLIVDKNRCRGVYTLNKHRGGVTSSLVTPPVNVYESKAVLLATGGIGRLYMHTSNSPIATGDGIASAYRAGAILADLEFMQFHPTALYSKSLPPGFPENLITETLRGEGALLVNKDRKPFMEKYSLRADLSSRDIVSRSIFKEMYATKTNSVFLDISRVENFTKKFPQIVDICKKLKINLSKKLIPVVPTAHYYMGGIKTDLCGRTNIKGLFAAGEAACTYLHGANRLASNSLSEGYIFAKSASEEIRKYTKAGVPSHPRALAPSSNVEFFGVNPKNSSVNEQRMGNLPKQIDDITARLKKIMWERASVFRCGRTLSIGLEGIKKLSKEFSAIENKIYNRRGERLLARVGQTFRSAAVETIIKFLELKNMLLLAKLIIKSALLRKESRGSHFRTDYPERNDKAWKKHITVAAGL